MTRIFFVVFFLVAAFSVQDARSQSWIVGGNTGLSITDGAAGFHIGPMAEYLLNKTSSVGTDFSINTQSGTPLIWWTFYRYRFAVSGSKVKPYVDGGPLLTFVSGGPYFGLMFGGGVDIPVAKNLSVAPEFQGGPVFGVGGSTTTFLGQTMKTEGRTIFAMALRAAVHYQIP